MFLRTQPTFWACSQIFTARVFSSTVLFGWRQSPNVTFIDAGYSGRITVRTTILKIAAASAIAIEPIVVLLAFPRRFICGGRSGAHGFHRWYWRVHFVAVYWFPIVGASLLACHQSAFLLVCRERRFFFFSELAFFCESSRVWATRKRKKNGECSDRCAPESKFHKIEMNRKEFGRNCCGATLCFYLICIICCSI